MKKHIISIILVLSLLLNCGIMNAFAQTEDNDDNITIYFHCPQEFTTDGIVRCEMVPKNNILTSELFYGEQMENGLYKFEVPNLSDYIFFVFCNGVNATSEVDPDSRITDGFVVAQNNSIYSYDSDELIDINDKIYTNFAIHWADWRYYYGYGDWMDFEEWNRYQAYLKYVSNDQFECPVLNSAFPENYWYKYKELYTFNNNVLSFGADNEKTSEPSYGVYGDYVLRNNESYSPSIFGYNVYLARSNEVVSLREAYDTNTDGIESVFSDFGLGELIGDVDNDRSLTILDATNIQRNLAQITEFSDDDKIEGVCEDDSISISYISDFNRDGKRDILDATTIQIRLASL